MTTTPLLEVEDLRLAYRGRSGTVEAVRGVAFQIAPGERVALVGESGSGKSTIASRIIGLQARSLETTAGSIRFQGRELLDAKPRALRHVRGREIGYVPQDPTVSLNPVKRIGEQVAEVLLLHRLEHRRLVHDCVLEALRDAGIDDPELRAGQYPHELSGGLRQRVLIAIALIASPALLIADEPTSALDVSVQKRVLELLVEIQQRLQFAVMFVTHDLAVVDLLAHRTVVMEHGRIVEYARRIRSSAHPPSPTPSGSSWPSRSPTRTNRSSVARRGPRCCASRPRATAATERRVSVPCATPVVHGTVLSGRKMSRIFPLPGSPV